MKGYFKYYSVKDPEFMLEWKPDAQKEIGEAFIAVSIPYANYVFDGENKGYYKIIAAIYPLL